MKFARIFSVLLLISLFNMEDIIAQDWPNLSRFKIANEALRDPAPNEQRVVFMGNSITEGWGQMVPDFFKNKPYINRGIGGQTTPQMLVRFRADVVHLKPAAVIILAGTNDIAGNTGPSTVEMIADNIFSMCETAHANGIKVIIASTLPAFDYPWAPGKQPNVKIPELNAQLKAYAEAKGHLYLDYFSAMDDGNNGLRKELTSDGVHPNKAGYEIMGPLTEKMIQKAIQIP